jgi:hypothetical protein
MAGAELDRRPILAPISAVERDWPAQVDTPTGQLGTGRGGGRTPDSQLAAQLAASKTPCPLAGFLRNPPQFYRSQSPARSAFQSSANGFGVTAMEDSTGLC